MAFVILISYIIAVFGICELMIYFDGPFGIIEWFRRTMHSISDKLGELFTCFACLSTWVGGILSIINLTLVYMPFTPFNMIFCDRELWWIIIPLDAAFSCATTWMLHQLEDMMERIGNDADEAENGQILND